MSDGRQARDRSRAMQDLGRVEAWAHAAVGDRSQPVIGRLRELIEGAQQAERPHTARNGDGTTVRLTCKEHDEYVARASWYARARAAEREAERLRAELREARLPSLEEVQQIFRAARLREALTRIAREGDYSSATMAAEALAESDDAIEHASNLVAACASCDGLGYQAGAHSERVEPCPSCGGDVTA